VLILASNSRASAEVPPNLSMMSEAVMAPTLAENASRSQGKIAFLINAPCGRISHKRPVLGSIEILRELERLNVDRKEIAKLLDIDAGAVTRLFYALRDNPPQTPRKLQHDEAVKLVEKYRLEQSPPVPPLPGAVWRLVARHASLRLGLSLEEDDQRVRDVAADLAAFSRFVRNPRVQGSIDAAQNFFEAMQSRREVEPIDQPENDPQPVR
jgi:hypothetical protein